MKKFFLFILIFVFICFFALGGLLLKDQIKEDKYTSPKSGTFIEKYEYNGLTREYILYIPDDLPENAPLVIGMHGYTSSPWTFKNNFGWDKVADENKFIVCYPQGTAEPNSGYSHWNAQLPLSDVDDVEFISDLALFLIDEYKLNKDRIFAAGFSNGGYMAYTLACERPDLFRAVASVSGLMSKDTYQSYNPYDFVPVRWLDSSQNIPIPICHIHGTDDSIVPIDGSVYLPAFESVLSAEDTVKFWARINRCIDLKTEIISENVTAYIYTSPDGKIQVWYYEYSGWAHYWPSKDYIVNKPSEINAQEIIWDFFSLYE